MKSEKSQRSTIKNYNISILMAIYKYHMKGEKSQRLTI